MPAPRNAAKEARFWAKVTLTKERNRHASAA